MDIVQEIPIKLKWPWYLRLPYYTSIMTIVYGIMYSQIQYPSSQFWNLALIMPYKQTYQYYTHSILHLNTAHFASNLPTLFIYGSLLEMNELFFRVFLIHTLSILGGAIACKWQYILRIGDSYAMIGASGGIFGLFSAQVGNLTLNWAELSNSARIIYTSLVVGALIPELAVNAFFYNPQVSYSAHAGGFIVGLTSSMFISQQIKKISTKNHIIVRAVGFALTALYFIAGGITIVISKT